MKAYENSTTPSSSQELRTALISTETSLKSTGSGFIAFGCLTLLVAVSLFTTVAAFEGGSEFAASHGVRIALGLAIFLAFV